MLVAVFAQLKDYLTTKQDASALSGLIKVVDDGSANITINSIDTWTTYYTVDETGQYDLVGVTPKRLGDSRLSFRGFNIKQETPTLQVNVAIANPSASTASANLIFRFILIKKGFLTSI